MEARFEKLLAERRGRLLRDLTRPRSAEEAAEEAAEELYRTTAETEGERYWQWMSTMPPIVKKRVPDGRGGYEIADVMESLPEGRCPRFFGTLAGRVGFLWRKHGWAIYPSPSFKSDLEKALEWQRGWWDLEKRSEAHNQDPSREFDALFDKNAYRWALNTLIRNALSPLPKELRPTRPAGRPARTARRQGQGPEAREVAAIGAELELLPRARGGDEWDAFLRNELGLDFEQLRDATGLRVTLCGRARLALMIRCARQARELRGSPRKLFNASERLRKKIALGA